MKYYHSIVHVCYMRCAGSRKKCNTCLGLEVFKVLTEEGVALVGTCYSHLSPDERIRIERLHCEQGLSVRETAGLIGRDKATVSRELKRGLWFASNENESYRPYRPRRLKTGVFV